MAMTRRELLRTSLGSTALLASGTTIPNFLAHSANACSRQSSLDGSGRVLVVVQLTGGNDGLNTIVPYADDLYYANRPKLGIPKKDLIRIDDHVGFHPSMKGFASMLDDGRLAIVQSVGYPNPSRSHFDSMAIWHTARTSTGPEHSGWLARSMDAFADGKSNDPPGMHIADEALPQALRGGRKHVPTIARSDDFRRKIGIEEESSAAEQRAKLDGIVRTSLTTENPVLQFIARSTIDSCASSAMLENVLKNVSGDDRDSEDLTRNLNLIAQMICSGLHTPIYYTGLDGFDTHSDQTFQHSSLLRELSTALKAFLDDLEKSGDADRVTVLVFSEFGRRLHENAGEGTDHGTAAPVFVLGRQVQAGLFGPNPNLADLDDHDPKFAIDFRRVYAGLIERWLELPPGDILGPGIESMKLIRG